LSAAAVRLATWATSGAAFFVLLLFTPTLQAPFLVPKFAALELTASLAWGAFMLRRATTDGPRWSPGISLGVLLVLATSVVAWVATSDGPHGAPYAVAALARWGALFGLACGSSVIADVPEARRQMLGVLTLAASVVSLVGLLQHIGAMPLGIPVISLPGSTFGNRNAAADAMAMSMPLSLGIAEATHRRDARATMYVGLLLQLLYLAVTRARGAWLGAACGASATLWLSRPRWSRTSLSIALAAVLVAALVASVPVRFNPHDAGDYKRYSGVFELFHDGLDAHSTALRTRIGLWRRTLSMVRDHPLFGVGPGNWPVEFPLYAEPDAAREGVLSATLAPRQAHNDTLERAAETGVPGLLALGLLGAGVAVAARRRLRTNDDDVRDMTAGATGGLVALVTLSIAGFPLEAPGTLALSGIALGLVSPSGQADASHADGSGDSARRTVSLGGALVGVLLLAISLVRAERSVRNSGWLATAERMMRRDRGVVRAAEAAEALDHALDARPADYRSQLRYAQVLLRLGESRDSAQAAHRALAIEPNAPNALAALAAAELASGDAKGARREATRALTILHDFPFAYDVRARASELEGDDLSALADREHLIALAASADADTARAARELLRPR
jgi:O-antigen ligase